MRPLQRLASLEHCDFPRAAVTPLQRHVCPVVEEEADVPGRVTVPATRPTRAVLHHDLGGLPQERVHRLEIIDSMMQLEFNIHENGDGLQIVTPLLLNGLNGPVVRKAIPALAMGRPFHLPQSIDTRALPSMVAD